MKTRTLHLVLVVVFVLIVAACGGSDDGGGDGGVDTTAATTSSGEDGGSTDTTAPAVTEDDDGEETPEQPAVGEAGTFTVNGTVFTVTLLNRCIPFTDGPGSIDLQALAQGPQGGKLNLYVAGDSLEVSVDGSGIQEMFGSIAFGQDPVVHESNLAGDRWTGSATVGDSLEVADPVDISWDVMIPSEVNDCSL